MNTGEKVRGDVIVISGPSGVGKGTVCKRLLAEIDDLWLSVSDTTRGIREGEIPDVSYHYISQEAFKKGIDEEKYVEYAPVFENFYGTPKEPLEKMLNLGYDAILEVDVQGGLRMMTQSEYHCVFIFLLPPSIEALFKRVTGRGTETPEQISLRFEKAKREIRTTTKYDYVIINDDLEETVETIKGIIEGNRRHTGRMQNFISALLEEEYHVENQ